MTIRYFPLAVLALVCSLSWQAMAGPTAPDVHSTVITLPASADFEMGSSVLTSQAQHKLQSIMSKLPQESLDSIIVTGFANTADRKHGTTLGLERARSVCAFFILNGIDPSRVYVDYGDFTSHRKGRSGQVQFDIIETDGH